MTVMESTIKNRLLNLGYCSNCSEQLIGKYSGNLQELLVITLQLSNIVDERAVKYVQPISAVSDLSPSPTATV